MHLTRRIYIQLAVFAIVALVAGTIMVVRFINLPTLLFGAGRYTVTVNLPEAAGIYPASNVTYRGTEVGRVDSVRLTDSGVSAVLSLKSDIEVPSDLDAEVHSQSAVGEQYISLLPRNGSSRALRDGDVVPVDRTKVPPDINSLLAATDRGLQAIPGDNLKTAIDESYVAFGGLGPDISRLVKGSTTTAIDARNNLGSILTLIDQSGPLLDAQTQSSDAVQTWAAHLASISSGLQRHDAGLHDILQNGPAAADEVQSLLERVRPTLPVLLANLATQAQVAIAYHANIEQLLVLFPVIVGNFQGVQVANKDLPPNQRRGFLSFNLNLNYPPPCTTGYLPARQLRNPVFEDAPENPPGELFCRVPQDSPIAVRGVRNTPCETRPGKRAPTVKMCESDENYVPLNDGLNWKGDPNATLSGQDIPRLTDLSSTPSGPVEPPASSPDVAAVPYAPSTGTYRTPDGKTYTQTDLGGASAQNKTWQTMLVPPN